MRKKYQITIGSQVDGKYPKGYAELIVNSSGDGYLWLGHERGCVAWIDERQLDAICKQWMKVREGKKAK